jgi:hypothetical protein
VEKNKKVHLLKILLECTGYIRIFAESVEPPRKRNAVLAYSCSPDA